MEYSHFEKENHCIGNMQQADLGSGLFVTYHHHIEASQELPETLRWRGLQIKAVNFCHKVVHLKCCSSLRSASWVKPIIVLHYIVKKWSVAWSVPSYAARKKYKLPPVSVTIQSITVLLPVKCTDTVQYKTQNLLLGKVCFAEWWKSYLKSLFMVHTCVRVRI